MVWVSFYLISIRKDRGTAITAAPLRGRGNGELPLLKGGNIFLITPDGGDDAHHARGARDGGVRDAPHSPRASP